jgi:hypothetical protein
MGEEGPCSGQAQQRRAHEYGQVGRDCGATCCGGAMVPRRTVRGSGQIHCGCRRNGRDVPGIPCPALRFCHRVRELLRSLYNPVAPVFSFSGGWQHAVVVASTVPFVASLAWRRVRTEHND